MNERPRYYRLVDDAPVPVTMDEMLRDPEMHTATWSEKARRIGYDTAWFGAIRVSTVFLVIDHNFGWEGPPVLFETMIFGGPLDQDCHRYTSAIEARKGHRRAVLVAWLSPLFVFRRLSRALEELWP